MVNTNLDRSYKAEKGPQFDFSPIPDNDYILRVKTIAPWKAETKNIKVIQRDSANKALIDDKGEKITTLVENCTFYKSNVRLEVVGGAYDGKLVFYELSTHPNQGYVIPAFLDALGIQEMAASDIPTKCIDKLCLASVITESYDKKTQNKDTGLDEIEKKYINKIKSFKDMPVTNANTINNSENDIGI